MFEFWTNKGQQKVGIIDTITPAGAIVMSPFELTGVAGTQAEAETAPADYLFCNGATVPIAQYAELNAAIGTTYNTGGEPGGTIRLPDFRGFFVGHRGGSLLIGGGGASTHTHVPSDHDHELADHVHATAPSYGPHSHAGIAHGHSLQEHRHSGGSLVVSGKAAGVQTTTVSLAAPSQSAAGVHQHVVTGYTGTSGADATAGTTQSLSHNGGTAFNYLPNTTATTTFSSTTYNTASNIPSFLTLSYMIRYVS